MVRVGQHLKVPVEKIEPIPIQLRRMAASQWNALKRSIREVGYVEYIQVVYYSGVDKYRIVNGQHRFEALLEEGVSEVDVIVIGEDLSEEEYLTEVIRLNNIHGEYDIVELSKIVSKLRKHYGDMLEPEFAEKLGFIPTDAIFKRALREVVASLPEEKRKKVEKKIRKGASVESVLEEASKMDEGFGILLTFGEGKYFVVRMSEEDWAKFMDFRAR
ncbi:MAG: ParB N-terminal domain-containing protein, partial [Candidatus Caldarchaeum sp.]